MEASGSYLRYVGAHNDGERQVDIAAWLTGLGLERYQQAFHENDIDGELLRRLTDDDLKDIDIASLGHRRKLLQAIDVLTAAPRGAPVPPHPSLASSTSQRDAERRQLTVMFIDLVGSTSLAGRLDPEDMRALITSYQNCCASVIGRFEGYLAKFMGDGVLAYFGWPTAHEDDAGRAIRAGLEITAAVAALICPRDVKLAARVGISTGPVIVGDLVGAGAAQEQAVVGETPHLAARIQSVAEPGTVAIGSRTRSLVGASFEYDDLGDRMLAGVNEPVRILRVLRPTPENSRFDAMRGSSLAPLIGRQEEVEILVRRWRLAEHGEGQVVLLSGEPGIGKSRLTRVLLEQIADEPHTRLRYQCSPLHVHSAFYPITAQIERVARFTAEDNPDQKLTKLRSLMERANTASSDDLLVFSASLGLPGGERYAQIEPDPERRRAGIFSAFLRQVEGLAAQRPVCCIFEDVHWCDPSTMDLLGRLIEWIPSRPVLLLITYRPEFASPWTGLAHCTVTALRRMSVRETTELISRVAGGKRLADEVERQIVLKTDGIPLFVEEVTRNLLESGILEPKDSEHVITRTPPVFTIPATLHDSLMARLDRLSTVRDVVQLGAVIGRSFDYRLLSAAAGPRAEPLTDGLVRLEEADLLVRRGNPPDASYSFRHALIQEAAYGSLLRVTRQAYHRRIAAALEQISSVPSTTIPEVLAHHYAEAGMPEPAIRYFRQAGENAMASSAYSETIDNFTKALGLLEQLPESIERLHEKLDILLALGGALVQKRGPASIEAEETYAAAWRLCDCFGTPQQRFMALWGLCFVQFLRVNTYRMHEYGGQLLPLAEELGDPALLLEAHHVQWASLSLIGDLRNALAHAEEGIARYDRGKHHRLKFVYGGHDPGACALNESARSLLILGYPDQARRRCKAALVLAHELSHPHTLLNGFWTVLLIDLLVRDLPAVEQEVAAFDDLVRGGKLPREASSLVDGFRGWALAERGAAGESLDLMRRASSTWQSFWGGWCFPLDSAMAGVLGQCAHMDEALDMIDQTLKTAKEGGAHWWSAELHRTRAGLLLSAGSDKRVVEAELQKAIATASAREARYFELRAARDLARVLAEQGERQQAADVLIPIYNEFTEGFDTPDLREAKTLLDELRS
jgi:class 3 adenylate cyclase/predicted ATPase